MVDLQQANSLMEEIAKRNSNISPIEQNDINIFQEAFSKDGNTYGNSWTYITQGVFGTGPSNLGYKYFDGKNISVMCVYPKLEDPSINVLYWIRPIGEGILDIISNVSQDVLNTYGLPSYVKKIFPIQQDYLKSKGFVSSEDFPWHTLSHAEDDTFPEQVIDTQLVREGLTSFGRRSGLRQSFRRSEKIRKGKSVEILSENFEKTAWEIARKFFEQQSIKSSRKNFSKAEDYYNPIFQNPDRKGLLKRLALVDNSPAGFYVFEQQSEDYSSLYAQLTLRDSFKDLPDFLFFNIFLNCPTRYVNLGGSEDIGIHEFKLKYRPVKEIPMKWAALTK
jgi:hypothetical protein